MPGSEVETNPNDIITARCCQCHEWLTTDEQAGGVRLVRIPEPSGEETYRPYWLCSACQSEDEPALIWLSHGRHTRRAR